MDSYICTLPGWLGITFLRVEGWIKTAVEVKMISQVPLTQVILPGPPSLDIMVTSCPLLSRIRCSVLPMNPVPPPACVRGICNVLHDSHRPTMTVIHTVYPFQIWGHNLWTGGQDKRKSSRCNEVYSHAKINPIVLPSSSTTFPAEITARGLLLASNYEDKSLTTELIINYLIIKFASRLA